MREDFIIIRPGGAGQTTGRLARLLDSALSGLAARHCIESAEGLRPLKNARLLFVVELGLLGVNPEYYAMLWRMRMEPGLFTDCLGALIVDGQSELFTKSVARELVFTANQAGCAFIGRPLVEGTGSLRNFQALAQAERSDTETAYRQAGAALVKRLLATPLGGPDTPQAPEILALHASSHPSSNTYALWGMVKEHLAGCRVTEIGLRNGALVDCSGCPYTTCLHFGEQGSCLYGGLMVEEVYPAVERCRSLVLLCPNYNDALPANLAACVNRLTALFRRQRFYEKRLYGLIVSGYSGGDIIAGQLIAALNMNKSFFLPPRFCLLETANEAGAIFQAPAVRERARDFARRIKV
jgi:hypothetical protein